MIDPRARVKGEADPSRRACARWWGRDALAVAALVAACVGSPVQAGNGQWTSNGPYGGQVTALAVDPQNPGNLYAAGVSGIFKSSNGGVSWARASTGITDPTVAAIAVDPVTPTTLYAGTLQGGHVVKSTDGGGTWAPLPTGPTLVVALAIPAQAPATIYASQQQSGIRKSTDGGTTWTSVGVATLPGFPTVKTLVVDPANPNTLYAGEQSRGVYKSVDGGVTWAASNTGFTTGSVIQVMKLAIDPQNPATLYAAANTSSGAGLYKSVNGGANWTQVFADNSGIIGVQAVLVDPQNPANVYIGTFGQGAMKSTNGGASFAAVNTGLPKAGVNVLAVNPSASANVYAGTQDGVYASANGGGAWTAASNGLALTTVTAVAVDPAVPTTVYAATSLSGLFKSVDGGDSWQAINTGVPATGNLACNAPSFSSLAIDPANSGTLYAGTQCTSSSQVLKSTNGGANWTAAASGLPGFAGVSVVAVDPKSPATVYAGMSSAGAYRSDDGGVHWTSAAGIPTTAHVSAISIDADPPPQVNTTSIVVATRGEGLYTSSAGAPFTQPAAGSSIGLESLAEPCAKVVAAVALSMKLKLTADNLILAIFLACGSVEDDSDGETITKPATMSLRDVVPKAAVTQTKWGAVDGDPAKSIKCAPATSIAEDPLTAGAFYATSACGVLRATRYGAQVSTSNAGLPAGIAMNAIAITPSGVDLYAGAQAGGVWRYTQTAAPAVPVPVIEFYNASLDHYFITWVTDEIAKLDAGTTIKGWTRTGQSFKTYTAAQPGTSPVCRYYIPPALGDSHFFGRGTAECDATGQKNPSFVRESPDFMQMFLPAAGVCPAGTVQVYRVFSNRPDANHRYMTDEGIRTQMTAKGWLAEGDGPDLVVMCAPQ